MKTLLAPALAIVAAACASPRIASPAGEPRDTVVLTSDIEWGQINPARGAASPMAGTLWGDRNGRGPTGFLLKPADGFESPPHIHNVSYRGVVIRGLIHNDDPSVEKSWMPAGSFWTQPRGLVHITAARGSDTLAYIEIDEGPYLVRSVDEAFHSKDRPVNVDASDVAWEDAPGVAGLRVAFLWGKAREHGPGGLLVQLPAGSTGILRSRGSTFRAVVIQGRVEHEAGSMEPGSYFRSQVGSAQVACEDGQDCIFYVRTEGTFEVVPVLAGVSLRASTRKRSLG